nr:hypothetical protein HmN_000938300 [Hymenolepis microstoma]
MICDMPTVNDYLIDVLLPSKEISVKVLNGMSRESNVSGDFQLAIEPRIKWKELEIRYKEPESEEIKPEEPEIKKIRKENSILVAEDALFLQLTYHFIHYKKEKS